MDPRPPDPDLSGFQKTLDNGTKFIALAWVLILPAAMLLSGVLYWMFRSLL
jgi:phosphate/sulfate permease